jgi:hypothetical protein
MGQRRPPDYSADYLISRAREARTMAERMTEPEVRSVLMEVVATYEWLAALASDEAAPVDRRPCGDVP